MRVYPDLFMLRCAFAFRQWLRKHVAYRICLDLLCGIPVFELLCHDVSLSHWVPDRIIPASVLGLEFGRMMACGQSQKKKFHEISI